MWGGSEDRAGDAVEVRKFKSSKAKGQRQKFKGKSSQVWKIKD